MIFNAYVNGSETEIKSKIRFNKGIKYCSICIVASIVVCVVVSCRGNFQNLQRAEYEFISTTLERNIKNCMKTKVKARKANSR